MIMMVKEVVLLWTVALWAASAEMLVNDSNKTLANIPATYYANITHLILQHNCIVMNSSDTQTLRNYSKLTELDLSYNLIVQLPDGAFSALSSLETLRLTGNQLQTIRNETFTDLKKLKTLDLAENPLNCTQELLTLMKWLNDAGLQTGPNATCATPENLAGKRILDVLKTSTTQLPPVTSNTVTTTKTTSTSTTVMSSTKAFITIQSPPRGTLTTVSSQNVSSKDTLIEDEQNGKPVVTNSWKFLTGVIVIILCTSMVIVCAVKSPTWYKMLFDYRHQRLHEAEEPSIFNTGRYSNFSLDTEQTETSAHELDQGLTEPAEDEDGFIEDGYIQPEDYKEHVDVDEV
ncbi:leucine-rich repeat-containing protein 19 [Pangasianodon hypophthalmus]|uniref:leucine-rich repeat-containing protein 19 n=1 Tax=Pangasianodon hypophthalmus TaxID=310915 RepID=UPI002306E46B|nr:leucine-rich repeat-containing protein 19 [Pangasianodon hypophthalmus]